jgi:hypothetical protein
MSDDSIAGIGQESVSTRLWYTDRWTYDNITSVNGEVTLTIVSLYATAWENYYKTTFENAGLVDGSDFNITAGSESIQITIDRVSEFALSHSFVETYLGRATTK